MNLDTNDDNFSAAFDRLAELGDATAKHDDDAMNAAAEEVDEAEPEPQAEPELEEAQDAAEGDAGEDTDDEGEEQPSAGPSDDELLARLAALVKDTPKEEPVAAPAPETEAAPIYTSEEQEFLAEYERDWPDVAKAESLRRRAEYHELASYIFKEIAQEVGPALDLIRTMSERTHLTELQSVVEDYDDVRDKVVDWVATQPTYLQPAYNHVIKHGTVDEVADLINRYKEATGVRLQAPAASKKETELPTATKQAAASLAPVSSKRSVVARAVDASDFESAFEQFADDL